jgi:hypothetical protein
MDKFPRNIKDTIISANIQSGPRDNVPRTFAVLEALRLRRCNRPAVTRDIVRANGFHVQGG